MAVAGAAAATAGASDRAAVELGRQLFYDADLSVDGTMSCATCHEQHRAFADGNQTRPGVHGEPGRRNVPGLFNLDRLTSYTWADPRINTLEAQVLVPVLGDGPVEMGMKVQEAEIATRLGRDPCYRRLFTQAFGSPGIDMSRVASAIATFERTLLSYDAPFDRGALPPQAAVGAAIFRRECQGCHAGTGLTDNRFHRIGDLTATGDGGLAEVTGEDADTGRFRTPSLRNVALTAPYFHDGRSSDLPSALARHGVSPADTAALIFFLHQLTGRKLMSDSRFSLPRHRCNRKL